MNGYVGKCRGSLLQIGTEWPLVAVIIVTNERPVDQARSIETKPVIRIQTTTPYVKILKWQHYHWASILYKIPGSFIIKQNSRPLFAPKYYNLYKFIASIL